MSAGYRNPKLSKVSIDIVNCGVEQTRGRPIQAVASFVTDKLRECCVVLCLLNVFGNGALGVQGRL
jgi:hypothetical protein